MVDFLAHHDVILGLLPLGTANDFARTLGIPADVEKACETIAGGKIVDVDLARPRGESTRYDPRYLEMHSHLWNMIRSEAERSI